MFTLKKDWKILEEEIARFKQETDEEEPEILKLREKIEQKMIKKIKSTDVNYILGLKKKQDERGIGKYFTNEIYNMTGDPGVKCEVLIDELDVFKFYKSNQEIPEEKDAAAKTEEAETTEVDQKTGIIAAPELAETKHTTETPQTTDQTKS